LKFDLSVDGEEASVEHAFARMSAAVGIRTVTTQIIAEGNGTNRRHLVVRRFDTPSLEEPQRRLHCHSLSTMLHKTPGVLDYRDFYRSAVRLGLPLAEIEEITRRMVFNVLAANADDHGKNHSFIYREESKTWELSPAYDLVYTPMMLERGMTIAGDVWPTIDRMANLAVDAGVECAKFDEIVARVECVISDWTQFAEEANVPQRKTLEIAERFRRIRASVFPVMIAQSALSLANKPPRRRA
jgi:serine/threonine-protein kinase HipA